MNKKMISFITSMALAISVFAGMSAVNAEATEKVYNFSELTKASYSKSGADVFNGAIHLSATENAAPLQLNAAAVLPSGNTANFTSALKTKKLKADINLAAGETMVVYYCGTDSAGASAKALEMQISNSGGDVVATEQNAENKLLKPYVIYYKAETADTYSVADISTGTNRTLMYAIAVTDGEYNPSLADATVPPATVNPDATPDPDATPAPAPTPKPTVDPNAVSQVEIKRAAGWLESAYVMWTNTIAVDKYNIYVKPEGGEYTKIDDELVRLYHGYYRADVLGLSAGKYQIKVAAVLGGEEKDVKETEILDVKAQIREGYAFDPKSANYNADGIGGYKMDGTVKDNAKIIYITDKNKDTVKADIVTDTGKGTVTSCTGLAEILAAREKNKAETTPLIIRMIGQVKSPAGKNSNGYMQIKATSNITFEGVGDDATTFNWSFLLRETKNIEMRNLAVMEFYDDGISLDTNNFNDWVHNCDIFYGQNRGGDQKKGDGSLDVKSGSDYCTFSYNHFWDSGKSSLCGMKDDNYMGYHITYHHNWFDHSDSRHPRVRGNIVHIYNNYYDGNSKYGAGSTTGSNLFVENNVFRNCKYPVLISMQGSDVAGGNAGTFSDEDGGMIKMFGNAIYGGYPVINAKDAPVEFDAYVADTRDEQVPDTYKAKQGGSVYNNFDTAADMYEYTPMSTDDVAVNVETYAGRVEGGDFTHQFNDSVDDESYDRDPVLGDALQNYKTTLTAEYATSSEYPATTEGTVPTPAPDTCVKIIAEYENGKLTSLTTEKNVKISDAAETGSGNTKIFYWYSLESMKPIK